MRWVDTLKYCTFQKYDSFTGRADRQEFYQFISLSIAIDILTYYLSDARFLNLLSQSIISLILGAVIIFLFIPSLAVTVRRLHDVNRRGINICWTFLPLFGIIYLLYLCSQRGQERDNRFGKGNTEPLWDDEILFNRQRIYQGISKYLETFQIGMSSRIFDYLSRASRREYWQFNAVFLLLNFLILYGYLFLLTIITAVVMIAGDGSNHLRSISDMLEFIMVLYAIFATLVIFVATLGHISVAVRRLHDLGLSGAFIFIALIPVINIIFIYFMMRNGTFGENLYGEDPLAYNEVRSLI